MKILLLTGYLGSGKTTLLNRILSNTEGIRFAVIVNDIGEVNIDADLIEKGGIVGKKDDSLVALQNGCICCTLKMDLVEQINEIMTMERFDYIVIEASGICEPAPIAQTICSIPSMGPQFTKHGTPHLDCIATVVDALRMKDEFGCGDALTSKQLDEDDIENLVIQQVEFCNLILLNKASEVEPAELQRIKDIIRTLQPEADIIECDYCNIPIRRLVNTQMFNFEQVVTSAGWIHEIEKEVAPEQHEHNHHHEHEHEHHHEHEHEHDHHHEHCHEHLHDGEGEAEEYGVGTFVYYRRRPLDINRFDHFVAKQMGRNIIRTKGVCWFAHDPDMSYLFETAGRQRSLTAAGQWYATMPEDELREVMEREPLLVRDWDDAYGDRMQKLVFIGQHLDKEKLTAELDLCLV